MVDGRGVAIVGIGCRLPGGIASAEDLADFLRLRGDAVIEVPASRWSSDLHFDPDAKKPGKTYVRHAAFLEHDVYAFDPDPFGVSPREADHLDPQQRLLLEVTWEAFEDAGIPVDSLRGSQTSVFIGGFTLDHQTLAYAPANRGLVSSHTSVGSSMTMLSNRLSYTFDLRGPSMTIDTACSSSLVATHLGVESIVRGECDVSVVGGVTVMLSPTTMVAMSKGQFLAPDGRSKTFDARADGYGRGEGAAVVVLKRLDLAIADGDRIYGVIAASGVNQDGRTDGITLPSGPAQAALCRQVLQASGLQPRDIGYIEAHGTGTRAGDPVEVRALGSVYGKDRDARLPVGSVKTNLGHLEAAAGVTGLIKAVLSIHNREIYPLRELGVTNPDIPFSELNLEPARSGRAWLDTMGTHAAVNAFGYGGTNAHIIVGPASPRAADGSPRATDDRRTLCLVPVSAASRAALAEHAGNLAGSIDETNWRNQAYTLARRRSHLPERAVILARSGEELAAELALLSRGEDSKNQVAGRAPAQHRLLWVFTGMGPQWWGMGRELYFAEPSFRRGMEAADRAFKLASGWSILKEMLRDESESRMQTNAIAQPSNFVLQVGLVTLLREYGVPEHGMLGHSVGEVAAAWASGCLSLSDAAFVAFHRSRLQQTVAGQGTMLAVSLSADDAARVIRDEPGVSIAAYNSPKSVTLAGTLAELTRLSQRLEASGTWSRLMPVEVAYHSPHMDPLEGQFHSVLDGIEPNAPHLPLYSTVTGNVVEGAPHGPDYWWNNARKPVLLQRALESAIEHGRYTVFLEIGPHAVLASSIREVCGSRNAESTTLSCLRRKEPERTTFVRSVGSLHASGVELEWARLHPQGHAADLPKYPFQREHHWKESDAGRDARIGTSDEATFFSAREDGPTIRLRSDLARPTMSYLYDHRIQGAVVFAGAGYLGAAQSACGALDLGVECVLEDFAFERPLVLRAHDAPTLLTDVDRETGAIAIYGRHGNAPWERHAHGRLLGGAGYEPRVPLDLGELEQAHPIELNVEDAYQRLSKLGLEYGPEFQRLSTLRSSHEADGSLSVLAGLRTDVAPTPQGCMHPAVLDAAFQAILAAVPGLSAAMVPVRLERIRWVKGNEVAAWASGRVTARTRGGLVAELDLSDASGNVILSIEGLECRHLDQAGASETSTTGRLLHTDSWVKDEARHTIVPASGKGQVWGLSGTAHRFLDGLKSKLEALGASTRALDAGESVEGCTKVVFAAATDESDPTGQSSCMDLIRTVQRLHRAPCGLRIVTFGAHARADEHRVAPSQTALWGLGRVVMTEHPELACRLVDLEPTLFDSMPLSALDDDGGEEETLWRAGALYARRIGRSDADHTLAPTSAVTGEYDGAYALEWDRSTNEARPGFVARRRTLPEGTDVEIAIASIELLPEDAADASRSANAGAGKAPRSFAGRVARTGPGVTTLQASDVVTGVIRGGVLSHVILPESRLVRLRGTNAARDTQYRALFTAWYAVRHVGRVQASETVLVHDADRDVGMLAVQIARSLGANVLATARSSVARRALALQGVRAYDPSTLDFVQAIRRDTEGAGVHVIVSAMPEPYRTKSVELLRAVGRFVELDPGQGPGLIPVRQITSGVSFSTVNLDALSDEEPAFFTQIVTEAMDAVERGLVELREPRRFGASKVAEALAAAGAGGAVLELGTGDGVVDTSAVKSALFESERTYWVTGGASGFGLATAEWLVERGARNVLIGSRRSALDVEAVGALERMRLRGARVEHRVLDVTSSESIAETLDFIRLRMPPLDGVFHSAMVLNDAAILELDDGAIEKVFKPKAYGAWLLYQATEALELSHFVLYSSVSASVGNPLQASYAGANAFLDGLAGFGRARGRRITSIGWGAISDVGVVARAGNTSRHLNSLGIQPIPARRALADLERVLAAGIAQAGIVDMNWPKWAQSFPDTSWRRLDQVTQGSESSEGDVFSRVRAELSALPAEERKTTVKGRVRAVACRVLRLSIDRVDDATSLRDSGLDSLMSLELQAALEAELGVTIPTIQILGGASIAELSNRILAAVEEDGSTPTPEAAVPDVADLRDLLLSRICVQPPYFALTDIERKDGWVEATARPVPPTEGEADVVSSAEAARHLAIIGSCAVSLAIDLPGKVYYPVLRAFYPDVRTELEATSELAEAGFESVRVRARCLSVDQRASRASAETELLGPTGNVILKLLVDYHVIPEAEFGNLFAAHRAPTNEESGADPYEAWATLPPVEERDDGSFSVDLGPVEAASCLGHFIDYPSLPVSIMVRHATQLLSACVQRTHGPDARLQIASGTATTFGFIFAGEPATLTARRSADDRDGRESWQVLVSSGGKTAATFDLVLDVFAARLSGLHLTSRARLTG